MGEENSDKKKEKENRILFITQEENIGSDLAELAV